MMAELNLQLLHLIVVEIFLDQVAFSFHPSSDIRGNVRDHPGYKELHHEDNVLWKDKAEQDNDLL